jgi:hypothetical protein
MVETEAVRKLRDQVRAAIALSAPTRWKHFWFEILDPGLDASRVGRPDIYVSGYSGELHLEAKLIKPAKWTTFKKNKSVLQSVLNHKVSEEQHLWLDNFAGRAGLTPWRTAWVMILIQKPHGRGVTLSHEAIVVPAGMTRQLLPTTRYENVRVVDPVQFILERTL